MQPPSVRSLVATVYVPSAIFGLGQGAAAPVVALTARELGASLGTAGLIVALGGLGHLLGDLPAGRLVGRYGERRAIIGGSLVGVLGVALCLVTGTLWGLAAGMLLAGVANSVWGLARQSYLAEAVPFAQRARAMSTLAGMMRLGFFVGPFLGAAAIHAFGLRAGFGVQLAALVLAAALMARLRDLPTTREAARGPGTAPVRRSRRGRSRPGARATVSLGSILTTHRRLLRTLGAGALLMGAARASRNAVLPLWAEHLGADASTTSLVFGLSSTIDVLCSYPAGVLMDRYGRRAVAVPAMLVLAAGYLVLPLATGIGSLALVAALLGLGNGLSNGVIMTIGADVAPAPTRAEFFGAWRLMHDAGMLAGPLAVAAITLLAPLAAASAAVGVATLVGSGVMWRFIPRYVRWPLVDPAPTPEDGPPSAVVVARPEPATRTSRGH